VLTDGQIAALRDKFGDRYRNLPQQDLQDLAAFLPAGSKGRDVFLFRLLIAANRYWAAPTSKEKGTLRSELRELDRVIGDLHSGMRRLTKLDRSRMYAPKNRMALTIIDRTLDELIFQSTVSFDQQFGREYRRFFFHDVLRLWEDCGGRVARSSNGTTPSGPTIRYLDHFCKLVMGDNRPSLHTLALYVRQFRLGSVW
jgi:hypothetical protein